MATLKQPQVFISYRGPELRQGFIAHLEKALKREGVNLYNEKDETKGKDLSFFWTRIEESKIAIVIFSSRYTESRWCLDELVKIKELMDDGKIIVIPIFFKVNPSQVMNLEGEFGDNFWNLCRTNRGLNITKWREALESIASRLGICFMEHSSESEIIILIVNKVLETILKLGGEDLSLPPTEKEKSTEVPTGKEEKHETDFEECHLFGMEQRMEQLEKKLEFDCNNTRIVGVVGMPGIGKTTLAMMLYEKWNHKFLCSAALQDIRKKSKDYGLVWLRKTLLELLLEGKSPVISDETTHGSVKAELLKRKIFAVLDDLSDKKQLEFLLGDLDWIKEGSKIVITTRDKSLLEGFADDIYVVPGLKGSHSMAALKQPQVFMSFRGAELRQSFIAHLEKALKQPQVFMSFRGAELRQSFIAHLEKALKNEGVNVYVEVEQSIGGDPSDLFIKGIEESEIALVIFSKMYTSSSWCLDELVKIKERVELGNLMVIPIFYKVNPSEVKRLDGEIGSNLWNHVKNTSELDKFKNWKEALDFVSAHLGLVLTDNSAESHFISTIVSEVKKLLSHLLSDSVQTEVKLPKKVPPQHQVFISYRGAELRNNFVSHLEMALEMERVNVYIEKVETRGEDLGTFLTKIEESKIAIVIFSSRYAESLWCLNELVKIKECVDDGKLLVIPIFYKVDPGQVTDLEGEFGDNFWNMWRITRDHNIIKWKEALNSVASRIGFYLREHSSESEIITIIVNEVLRIIVQLESENPSLLPSTETGKSTEVTTGKEEKHETYVNERLLFGMEQRMEQLEKKLEFDCKNTRIVGVVGMPGIGKTTLAMMLYEKWKYIFLSSAALQDIRKKSEDYGLVWLRKTLRELLLEGNFSMISDEITNESMKATLLNRKIFVVLDDVSEKKELEFLLGDLDWMKKGSKIVITTRDKSLLEGFANDTYVVPELNSRDALYIFSYHAFSDQMNRPSVTFLTLSNMFVDYARGHPLALILLGKELCQKDKVYWEDKLKSLTTNSSMMFENLFYTDRLSEKQNDVFLDIVCFFKSEDEYFVRNLLDSGDLDSSDSLSEVEELANKFLISISDGRIEMNVPLFPFGKDLRPPRWHRPCNHKEIINILMSNKISGANNFIKKEQGANNVRGIFLDISELTRRICLESSTFTDMYNLRYLKIYDSSCAPHCEGYCKLVFPEGLEFSLEEVRYLHWVKFPFHALPLDFRPDNLVDLRLPYSAIERVWEGVKHTPRLKWVDLSHSNYLLDLSALSAAVNLQRLNLEGCTNLEELPVEIQNMKDLVFLNLRGCISLWSLPKMNLISLKTLILSDCSKLQHFQPISESVEFLHLDGTAIEGLPTAIQNLQKLVVLNLKNCKMLESLPNCLGQLKVLDELILSGCSRLKNIPDVRNSLKHLQILLLDGTGAKEMPSISCFSGSEGTTFVEMFRQRIGSHSSATEWPCGVDRASSLRHLCLSGNECVSLQTDIGKLYNLKWLDVKQCKKLRSLPTLPPRLQYLDAHGCDSLERVANPLAFPLVSDQIHATFNFSNCNKLDQDSKDNIISYIRRRSQLALDEVTRYNRGLVFEASIGTCFPGWEVPAWFSHRAYGSVLKPKLPPHWRANNLTGIGLCAVIVFDGYQNQRKRVLVTCNCEFKNEYGSSVRFSCSVGGWSEPQKLESSHVFIGFTSKSDINQITIEDDGEKCLPTETSIEFQVTDGTKEIRSCEVVKCGFSLVYAPEERGNIV